MGLLNLTEEQKENMRECKYNLDIFIIEHKESANEATMLQMQALSCILTVLNGD